MTKKLRIAIFAAMLLTASIFAADVRVGKYVAGDSRYDLDQDYWILLNSDGTAGIHAPGGAANGTWSFDGQYISIKITTAYGELAGVRGETFTLTQVDASGSVLYDGDDTYWLQ